MPEIDELLVSFSLWGDGLDPDVITALLQLTPSDRHINIDAIPQNPVGNWHLESSLDRHAPLDDHLQWLLKQLLPVIDKVRPIQAGGATAEFDCAIWVSTSQEGTTIQASTLAGMAELGATFGLTVYGGGGDGEEQ